MLSVTASRQRSSVVASFAIEAAEAGTSERHAPACYGVGAGSAGTPTGTLERGGTARGLSDIVASSIRAHFVATLNRCCLVFRGAIVGRKPIGLVALTAAERDDPPQAGQAGSSHPPGHYSRLTIAGRPPLTRHTNPHAAQYETSRIGIEKPNACRRHGLSRRFRSR